jgi:hypothetical protein
MSDAAAAAADVPAAEAPAAASDQADEQVFVEEAEQEHMLDDALVVNVTVVTPDGRVQLHNMLTTADSLMVVREFLVGWPETCHFTCYNLVPVDEDTLQPLLAKGEEVSDYAEFSQIPALENRERIVLLMVPKRYSLREVREHVWRLRSIVKDPPARSKLLIVSDPAATAGAESSGGAAGDATADAGKSQQRSQQPQQPQQEGEQKPADSEGHDDSVAALDSSSAAAAAAAAGAGPTLASTPDGSAAAATDGGAAPEPEGETAATQPLTVDFDTARLMAQTQLRDAQLRFPNVQVPVPISLTTLHEPADERLAAEEDAGEEEEEEHDTTKDHHSKDSSKDHHGKHSQGSDSNRGHGRGRRHKGKGGSAGGRNHQKEHRSNGHHHHHNNKHSAEDDPDQLPVCFKSICFSGFNPPPMHRQLLGDLCYLELTTEEGNMYVAAAAASAAAVPAAAQPQSQCRLVTRSCLGNTASLVTAAHTEHAFLPHPASSFVHVLRAYLCAFLAVFLRALRVPLHACFPPLVLLLGTS